jgi:hypothetical protein
MKKYEIAVLLQDWDGLGHGRHSICKGRWTVSLNLGSVTTWR